MHPRISRSGRVALAALVALAATHSGDAAEIQRGVRFAVLGQTELKLDFYPSESNEPAPLIVWVHGGAWRSGDRGDMPLTALGARGYALASVDYRLSGDAQFPAQVHDIKAAIRFLRAHAAEYGVDPARIAIAGSSAGGHLAALVGVSGGVRDLEGSVGDCLDASSNVQAIVDMFGPTNLTTILAQSTPHGLGVRVPALALLLGGQPDAHAAAARLASPVFHVDAGDPPLLMIHGDQDPQVPINQSHELDGRYREAGLAVQFEVIHGGAHGGDAFFDAQRLDLVTKFLDRHLARGK